MKPQSGQEIYIYSSYYVYRGEDDFNGGKAIIDKVFFNENLPKNHVNYCMISIVGKPCTKYNYKDLMSQQKLLKKEFKEQIAHPNPDYREEFNQPNADWV